MIKKQCVNKNKQMPESESEYLCGASSRPNRGSRSKESESGRSMVEMLGVLAIMGVLAIGGIAGYRYAMDKYNANEILNEVRKRAVTASQQRILGRTIDLSEWSNTIQGHPVVTADNYNGDTSFFALTVSGIEQGVCDHVIKEKILFAVEEKVGEVVVGEDTTCAEGENAVTFAFANDLASSSGSDGDGGEGNPPEEFDPTAPENNVICGVSGVSAGQCYRCDDGSFAPSDLDDSMCSVCSNRENINGYCALKDCDGFQTSWGVCYPCDTPEGIVASEAECNKCEGIRERNSSGYCNLKSACENGFRDSYGRCYPCDTPEGVWVGSEGTCEEACRGSGYERVKNGSNYCILNVPCDGFQTSSGACYPCDTASAIDVGSDGTCSEACTDVKRFKKGGSCNLCPKNVASPALNTQEMCEACGGQWSGSVCCDGDRCATTTTP